MYKDTKLRSILKTISWRFWATATTIALVFLFIGEPEVAFSIGIIEVILKMLIYFVHERTWDKIKYGRKELEPFVVWLTGLTRSGKTEIATKLSKMIEEKGLKVEHLDGHTVRNIFTETGFSRAEVNEHIKRVGYLAGKLEKHGIFVISAFISPYKESREYVRKLTNNFIEVHVATPLEVCEKNDDKGRYEKARKGELQNFPGVNAPYDVPENPDLVVMSNGMDTDGAAEKIYNHIKKYF